jgi:hypothetical protein
MEGWVHSLVYSTPAAARYGIIMSWTNKENEGGRTCKVTKYRMIRWRVNEIRGISNVSKERKGSAEGSVAERL